MKRWVLIIGALVVLLAAGVVAYQRSRAVGNDVFRTREVLVTFRDANEVTAERLHYRRSSPQNPFRLDSYDHDTPVAVASVDAEEMQRLLLQRSSYVWESAKACAPDYGMVFTFRRAGATVRVALCFECEMLGVFDGARSDAQGINAEGDFDPITVPLAAIAKHTFPNDPEIQRLP